MQRPSIKHLPDPWRRAICDAAQKLGGRGFRAWIVGGAVRDLALGRIPKDADLTSAAPPEVVEELFEKTHAVGKALGTVRVFLSGTELEVTTFRREGKYRDGRHPQQVEWGGSVEEDARRRDFTSNALFLDPLTDEICDPTGGLADIEAGRLRCVGNPMERFAEDGLRILRLARFAARFDWAVEPATLAAAADGLAALRGVSAERVLAELQSMGDGERPARALDILLRCGALERLFPALKPSLEARCLAVERHSPDGSPVGVALFLALFFFPVDEGPGRAELEALRPSRVLTRTLEATWALTLRLQQALAEISLSRAARIRLVRSEVFRRAIHVLRAWQLLFDERELVRWEAFEAQLTQEERFPTPWLSGADLIALGVKPGPRYAAVLYAAEEHRLAGDHPSRETALAWLRGRVAEPD
ncbi:MAG: hypothetical protein CMJ89_07685 [Planctomycetes bacterium]|nr:hypothetical protein [Planctomycetota bacterium]